MIPTNLYLARICRQNIKSNG
uniref:Uncharacterized protein n=1 Tax=Rhizophora mucronata TaxID=61149 RepID=A0A2P2NNY1_RHIMU